MASDTPTVKQFYKDKTIFITGASGFMGKVLVEKLLYSCSDLKAIYIMLRPKRGKVPKSRVEDMFKLPLFQRLRDEKPEMFKKLHAFQGDVTFDELGLSTEDTKEITANTNIVFHLAATLRLEANLKDAIEMNTTGTKRVIDLARKMPNLECFIYSSTAFCCADQDILLEKVYDCPHSPYDLMRCAEWMDAKTLDQITPNLIHPHPNTYTYSKRLAEILVRDYFKELPVVIVRPSIVTPAVFSPLPGWVDSLNGPIGIMVGAGKGVIRSMVCNKDYDAEVIPVDVAINGLITAVWKESLFGGTKAKDIPVYNITCPETKRTSWGTVLNMGKQISREYPFEAGVWYPDGDITTSRLVYTFNSIFFHWLPAYFIDFLMFIFGQKRFMVRIQTRVYQGLELLSFFTTRIWDFKSPNYASLQNTLSEDDKKDFNMYTDDVDVYDYLKTVILGGRQFCLKEPLSSLPKARMQLKALYVLDRVTKLVLFCLFAWWVLKCFGWTEPIKDYFRTSRV
uniref:Fatty acyl-CoA reductase n=1 Tax=Culicoides sonorensis TaxID=179676 RepID=A0A336KQE3_CULSO